MAYDDDIGGGGPFPYYPVSADSLHESAAEIERRCVELDAIRRQLAGAHRPALRAVDGLLVDPVREAPNAGYTTADRIAQTTTYTAGCLHLFADFVHEHNETSTSPRSISLLNQAYTEARLNNLGLDEAAYGKGGWMADRDYEADRRTRRATLLGELRAEYAELQARLDIKAEAIAAMLRRGPNIDDVRTLWTLGALPSRADSLWAFYGINEVPLLRLPPDLRDGYDDTRNLYDLTPDELAEIAGIGSETDGFSPAAILYAHWQAQQPSDDEAPWEKLDDVATFIFGDPRVCIGDDASLGSCGLEVLGILPFGKPIKAYKAYRATRRFERLKRAPEPGPEIPPIHDGRQGKHIPGHPNYDPDRTKSILEVDPHLIRKLAGTGTPRNNIPRGDPNFKEVVDCGFRVGIWKNREGDMAESTKAVIVYAKDGIHIYPSTP